MVASPRTFRPLLPALLILLPLAFSAVRAGHAQEDGARFLKLRVLAWNRDISELYILNPQGAERERIDATHGRISPTYEVPVRGQLVLHAKTTNAQGDTVFEPAITKPVSPDLSEALLIARRSESGYAGLLVPFAENEVPYNAISIYNLTAYRIAALIDGTEHRIPPRKKISVPFEYDKEDRRVLRSRFAAKTDDGWEVAKNGFITLQPNSRILYFISDDFASEKHRRNQPVRFTYIRERLRSEEERRQIEAVEFPEFDERSME